MAAGSELLLSSRAVKELRGLGSDIREELADEMRRAIGEGANESVEITGLNELYRMVRVRGYMIIYRQLTSEELRKQGKANVERGYIIFDILPPESIRTRDNLF